MFVSDKFVFDLLDDELEDFSVLEPPAEPGETVMSSGLVMDSDLVLS